MGTIKGIFEPFARYVRKQLNIRKEVLSNSKTQTITSRKRSSSELFFAYSTEKQCNIRMMSGVDLTNYSMLEPEERYLQSPKGLAKQYILEGGTRYYNDKIKWGWRGGFTTGIKADNDLYAYAYGDPNVRANADGDDFGTVPMPGIIDAEIRTKSDDGSLREAKINFICFNRRQLDVLELLYMRPGYPICLEWGWNPYVSNERTRETNDYTIKKVFFQEYPYENSTIEDINEKIRERKESSGGNYDGFVGYVKNFTYKVREDGGYDCSTELMAHGEILESLKSPAIKTHRKIEGVEDPVVEYTDRLLFYLRAIKNTLNGAGEQFFMARFMQAKEADQMLSLSGEGAVNNSPELLVPPQSKFQFGDKQVQIKGGAYDEEFNYQEEFYTNLDKLEGFKQNYQNELNDTSNPNTKAYLQSTSTEADPVNKNIMDVTGTSPEWVEGEGGQNFRLPTNEEKELQYTDSMGSDGAATNRWNYYVQLKTHELNLNTPIEYRLGFRDLIMLYNFINKKPSSNNLEDNENTFDPIAGKGFEALLGGAILKQTVKYNAALNQGPGYKSHPSSQNKNATHVYDSGYRRNIYIRWDFICQIMNHLSQKDKNELSSTISNLYESNSKNPNNTKLHTSMIELTYMGPNQRTWNNRDPEKGRSSKKTDGKDYNYYLSYGPCLNTLADPSYADDKPADLKDKYHPVIGNSYNERVCLLPHMSIFDDMFENDKLRHESTIEVREQGALYKDTPESKEESVGLDVISSYKTKEKASNMRNSIGFIYFNLDFLISTYESLRLKTVKDQNAALRQELLTGDKVSTITLNEDFGLYDWVKALWQGVNDATANYYNFKVLTEHEKANKIRVVDMRVSGLPVDDEIYEFEPQGLRSVTREFYFDSKITADIASTISIAAQAPNSQQSLESLSFKAFHKNIKSRFITKDDLTKQERKEILIKQRNKLEEQIHDLNKAFSMLTYYLKRLKSSDFQGKFHIIGPSEGIKQAKEFSDLRRIILNKYPLYSVNEETQERTYHKYAGQWREGTTTDNQAIIPLQCNFKIDGIAGMIPLQLFKINKNKLPYGYQRDNIAFIIKSESHKISSGQDWTTDITGQLTLLNSNPNNDGTNNILEDIEPSEIVDLLNDPQYAASYTPYADYLREVSNLYGHKENDYSGTSPIGNNKGIKDGFYAGELSSHDDLSPEMAAMGVIIIGCMQDENYCNDIVWGKGKWGQTVDSAQMTFDAMFDDDGEMLSQEDQTTAVEETQATIEESNNEAEANNVADYVYTNDDILRDINITWTGGNDKEHAKPRYGRSRHQDGMGLDFIIHSPGVRELKSMITPQGTFDPSVKKFNNGFVDWDEVVGNRGSELSQKYNALDGGRPDDVWDGGQHYVHPKHIDVLGNTPYYTEDDIEDDQNAFEDEKDWMSKRRNRKLYEAQGEFAGKPKGPLMVGPGYEPGYGKGAHLLNATYKLFTFLRIRFPNLAFIDEYRNPGRTATGAHWHCGGFGGSTTPVCTIDRSKLSGGKIWINELNGGEGGYVTLPGGQEVLVGQ